MSGREDDSSEPQQREVADPSTTPALFRGAKGDYRFVILTHDHPFLHWDLMLEEGDALTTFRLLEEPVGEGIIPAEPLPPHRKAYLDYEGPVSGGRGTVMRWDHGTCRPLHQNETEQVWRLMGTHINATITLSSDGSHWSCKFERHTDKQA